MEAEPLWWIWVSSLYLSSTTYRWSLLSRDRGWYSGFRRGREQQGTWTHAVHIDIRHTQKSGNSGSRKLHIADDIFLQTMQDQIVGFGGPKF